MCFILTGQNSFVNMFQSENENFFLSDVLCNNFHGLTMNFDQGFFPTVSFKVQKIFVNIRSFGFLFVICIFTISLGNTGIKTSPVLLEVSLLKSEPILTLFNQQSYNIE